MRLLIVIIFSISLIPAAVGQSYAFGLKGGLTVANQKWSGFDKEPLLKAHGSAFIETAEEDESTSLFAQLGYHLKGSANRYRPVNWINGEIYDFQIDKFIFRNISLVLGAKNRFAAKNFGNLYYILAIRGDYTLNTNLDAYTEVNSFYPIFPFDEYVRKLNAGATLGVGAEWGLSELVQGLAELTVNPDVTQQYFQPPLANIINPYQPTQTYTIPERKIFNFTIELTLGLRFTHKIVYVD